MRRVYQIASLIFLAFSAYLVFKSRQMEYYADLGPGPGFFPFWLGALLAVLSIIWLVQVSLGPGGAIAGGFIPDRRGLVRIIAVLVAMALFGWVVDDLGFQLTMLLFLGSLLMVLGRQNLLVTATVALAGSFGVYYVFTHWLDVQLPASSIEFLRNLGL
jgi:putative tricarboxylic transport membrane protein